MAIYLISYDLNNYDQSYAEVARILTNMGAVKCLFSQWLVRSDQTALEVANRVEAALDQDDRILVVAVRVSAYRNLMNQAKSLELLQLAS